MGSSIPAARAALYAALSGSEDLTGVQVTFGPPEAHNEEREVVALLAAVDVTTDDAALGGSRQEERYAIKGRLKVHDPTATVEDLPTLDARAWALYDAVRDAVQADRTLGGALTSGFATVSTAADDEIESPFPAVDENEQPVGWVSFIGWRVNCWDRVT